MNLLTVVFYKIVLCVQEITTSLTFGVIYDGTKGVTGTLGQGGKPATGLTRPRSSSNRYHVEDAKQRPLNVP